MARSCGTGTVAIRRSHHIACLAAYLTRATEQGLMIVLACSDPNSASVAPHGGTRAVFTPDPLALGFPTAGEPVLVDISASLTTNGMTGRLHRQGKTLASAWLLDAAGNASADPAVLFTNPPGTILPLGGLDAGHKGYGLALLVESLTGGLAGFGRADPKEGWGATVDRAGLRSGGLRLARAVRAPDGSDRRPSAAAIRRVPASTGCGCPASAAWRAAAGSSRRASNCTPTSCQRSRRGRSATDWRCPRQSEALAPWRRRASRHADRLLHLADEGLLLVADRHPTEAKEAAFLRRVRGSFGHADEHPR